MSPPKVSFMVSAMPWAVPSDSLRAFSKPLTLSTPSPSISDRAVMEVDVNVVISAACWSADPMPLMAFWTSPRTDTRLLKLPLASLTLTLASPILMLPSFILAVMSLTTAVRAVAASLPPVPWFAIAMSRAVVVSTVCPAPFILAAALK